jgi:hypothetical protein
MKKIIALCLAALCVFGSQAQVPQPPSGTLISPNLVGICTPGQVPVNGACTPTWTGTTPITAIGGTTGGTSPGYISSTNTIAFGWQSKTAAYTYAFSTALQNSGMTILGYNYSWEYLNQDFSKGTLTANVNFAGTSGSSLHSKSWTLGTTTESWTTTSGTETFTGTGLAASNIANFSLSFTGKDSRNWAGYYGPQVRNPTLSLNYTFDQCSANPLSSPTCSGYAQAYHDQQCTANPLYATDCAGYAAAYQTQQCTSNPLSSPQCPGYEQAYQTQQCSLNPLYATTCPGYQQAYFNQQCSANSLYSVDCPGYATAYKAQQCTASPLYATDCPGYQQAYLTQQCTTNPLYSTQCTGYAKAYALKNIVSTPSVTTTTATASTSTTISVTTVTPTVSSSGTVSVAPSTTGDTTVDAVIATPVTTSTSSTTSISPAATNSVVTPSAPAGSPMSQAMTTAATPAKESAPSTPTQQASSQQSGPRQQTREPDQKQAEARARVASENMKNATRMEDQVAAQGAVVSSMAFVPGFSAYQNALVPDINQLRMARQYSKPPIDNNRTQRLLGGAQERRWQEIVDSQYKEQQ